MAAPTTTPRIKQQAPPALAISGLFSVGSFLPPQTLPARRECKGMAATLREGTAPKLETGKCVAWVGETIASRTGQPGNAPIGAANPASSDSPFTKLARSGYGAPFSSENVERR